MVNAMEDTILPILVPVPCSGTGAVSTTKGTWFEAGLEVGIDLWD